jgi:aldehyde dehydrogenase (NAD+)
MKGKAMKQDILDDITTAFALQKSYKTQMKNTSCEYRLNKIKKFKKVLLARKDEVNKALLSDFHKPQVETELTEIMPVISMINLLEKELSSWMKDKKIKTPLLFKGAKSWVRHEGKGNCLIIAPWNYPFQLNVYPVLTAFAAGNTCIVKPSEFTPNTNKVIGLLFEEVFSAQEVQMFEGEIDICTELLKLPFDHIFFTGSTNVGKIVMEAASKHLASVALELGGKSPVIVDKNIDIDSAAKKIIWGKLVNSGQTCVAPDYILIHSEDQDKFIDSMISHVSDFYSENWKNEKDYCHIITKRHADRLNLLIEDAIDKGATVKAGGEYFPDEKLITPTILINVSSDMKIMQEEIFGPILPVIGMESVVEMIDYINDFDNALAMYIFSEKKSNINQIMNQTVSGGVTINDTLISVGHPILPFGGAGKSGIGSYHGKYGFDEFSNHRSVMKRDFDLGTSYFYPPYTTKKEKIVSNLIQKFSSIF